MTTLINWLLGRKSQNDIKGIKGIKVISGWGDITQKAINAEAAVGFYLTAKLPITMTS